MALVDIVKANVERLGIERGYTHRKNGNLELSAPQLSEATRKQVATSTINYLRSLTVSPNIETIELLAKALRVPPWFLLVDPEDPVAQLVNLYTAATDEDRKSILHFVQSAVSLKSARN